MVVTNMTLRHTQSRIFHGDTLQYWYKEDQLLLENVAFIHVIHCKHPRCLHIFKSNMILTPVIPKIIKSMKEDRY